MKKQKSKELYLRYKFQSELLDCIAMKNHPVKTSEIALHIPHFKSKKKYNGMDLMYSELFFLESIGLCEVCDNEGKAIESIESFLNKCFKGEHYLCSILTEKGIEVVQNRTYESLYISTFLNYRMYQLSRFSIILACASIIIAIFVAFCG